MKQLRILALLALSLALAPSARAACTGTCSITNVGVTFTGGGMSAHATLSSDGQRVDYYVDGIATGNSLTPPNYTTAINTFITVGPGMHAVFARGTFSGGTVDSPTQQIFVTDQTFCAGAGFTCSLSNDGTSGIYCWGDNYYGEVGDGTSGTNRLSPVHINGVSSARSVVCGDQFACALITDGSVKCWGENYNGQLGLGTSDNSAHPFPTTVPGLAAISLGASGQGNTICAVTTTGAVKCWGANNGGQVGDGSTVDRSSPTQVSGLTSGATFAVVGIGDGCAIVGGSLKCWGDNTYGQMGNGTTSTTPFTTPQQIPGLTSGVTWVSSGATILAVQNGALKTWGYNAYGGVGDGTTTDRYAPVTIAASGSVNGFVGPFGDSCAVINHVPMCWGINSIGQAGTGSTTPAIVTTPTQVGGQAFGALWAVNTLWHSCDVYGVGVAEALYCWADNSNGELGNGTTTSSLTPVHVPGF